MEKIFVLGPDKKTLYINLENKIQTLDLNSGKLTDLFTAKKEVAGMAFSPIAVIFKL